MRTSPVLFVPFLLGSLAGQETEVPEFHTDKAKASYVLAVPPAHDAKVPTPLILDFHGAAPPSRKAANITNQRVWSKFVAAQPVLVLGLNSRTRAWNMTKGAKDDAAYALHVLALIGKQHALQQDEIYLAGFSSGSDFLCSGGLQQKGRFAGSLVVCPGPSHVVGLRRGELLEAKDHPFYFVTGEADYIRKDGAWQAFLALDKAGGRVMYREVPGLDHSFPDQAEYARAFAYLRSLAGHLALDLGKFVPEALARGDYLLASSYYGMIESVEAARRFAEIGARGAELMAAAAKLSWQDDPARAHEAWWKVRTQFHRYPELAAAAEKELQADHGVSRRDLYKLLREYFRNGGAAGPRRAPTTPRAGREPPTVEPPVVKPPAVEPPVVKPPVAEPPVVKPPVIKPPVVKPPTPPSTAPQRSIRRPPTRRPPKTFVKSKAAVGPWSFDRYLDYDEVTARLKLLAAENPQRVRLSSMGKSIQGRDLWVCEISDFSRGEPGDKPAAYVQGGIHGNEINSVMVALYFAWQMGANPDRRRSITRLLRDTTLYVAPAVNPDAAHLFVTQPNTLWRPRFNARPHDADGDGRVDEDGYEDLDGDGEISQMYVADPKGDFVLRDGRMVRAARGAPAQAPAQAQVTRFRHVGREGIDNDGDGRYSEDPLGGVNLNRNFPMGFAARRDFEGFRGSGPASEPETRAIVDFVGGHQNVAMFFDYHNAADCVFYWIGPDGQRRDAGDFALMTDTATRAHKALGYAPRPLDHGGVGLSIAWAYGEACIPAWIVELDVPDPQTWGGEAQIFVPARRHQHPQLGEVWIGNDYKKLPKRNPHPRDLYDQAHGNWEFLRDELKGLAKLTLEQQRIVRGADFVTFEVTGRIVNKGTLPMVTERAHRLGKAAPITISARGAKVVGTTSLPPLAGGAGVDFAVTLSELQESVTLVVAQPRAGSFELPVRRPRLASVALRSRGDYRVEAGWHKVDDAVVADNGFFVKGVAAEERGPAFELKQHQRQLRVAVLLGEFADFKHVVPARTFEASMFGLGTYGETSHTGQQVYGSVREFYREMSYGEKDVTGRVFDWLELPGAYQDYRKASFGSSKFRTALEAAVLARYGADALDGFDGMVFVWAGNPVHRVSCLWPMRVPLKHRPGVIAFKMGEFYRGQMAAIGVACHEMGHTFGVNDKYGLGAPKLPMGRWCLMCKGTHGWGESMQHRPFHLCAWCKSVIGWVKPRVIDPATPQKLALRPILSSPHECYRILLRPDGSEYLLLENRRREGFMTELPSPGLVVLKVGPNDRPSAPQKQCQLIPAHGQGPASRDELQRLGEIAWPQPGRTEVTIGKVRLSGIRRVDDVVYFEVSTVD